MSNIYNFIHKNCHPKIYNFSHQEQSFDLKNHKFHRITEKEIILNI